MKFFVTGATGYVGSAVAAELLAAGHEVAGLTSSEEKIADLEGAGIAPVLGSMADPGSWRSAAARCEGLIHCAMDYSDPVELDATAIETLLSAAGEGASGRRLVYTSGVWVLGNTGDRPADEGAPTDQPAEAVAWRPEHERAVLDGGGRHTATAVIRPGVVYGGGGHGDNLMHRFFESAEERGASEYLGDGENRMALVYRDDAARLYRMVAEEAATGVLHAVDGAPLRMAEVSREASRAAGAGGEVRSVPMEEARGELGPVADALALDQVVEARRSAELGWRPEVPSYRDGVERAYREWTAGRSEEEE